MASTSSSALAIHSSSNFVDTKALAKCSWKSTAYCCKIARNVMAMAIGEAPTEVALAELPEIVKTLQEVWDKVDDKYAVSSLGIAAFVALWGFVGMIGAIDRLPLIPGVLEVVGIGYNGVSCILV